MSLNDLVATFEVFFRSVFSAGARVLIRHDLADTFANLSEGSILAHAERLAWPPTRAEVLELLAKPSKFGSTSTPADVVKEFENATGLGVLLLSDSLVLYSPAVSGRSSYDRFIESVLLARVVAMGFFESGLPVGGAISAGDFHVDLKAQIYCGSGLIEAYEVSESQDWIGVAIAPSAEALARLAVESFDTTNPFRGVRPGWDLVRCDIPFKSGPKLGWVVNWVSAWNAGGAIRDDFFSSRLTGVKDIDVKYTNTLSFIKNWRRLWKDGDISHPY